MPSSIPYDPALALGSVVPQEKLDNVIKIADLQAPADAAQFRFNSAVALKHSIDMTIQELLGLNIDPSDEIKGELETAKAEVINAAKDYAQKKSQRKKPLQK
jgi:hypothetical protein